MTGEAIGEQLSAIYTRDARRIFATLVRLLGNFDLAEEALHNAFVAAAERWPVEGVPDNPQAWLVSTGRFKAIDYTRRQRRFASWDDAIEVAEIAQEDRTHGEELLPDDQLRLIFTCCHPSLSEEACVALTLREVCGLTTEAIAHACLVSSVTLAQRIVRAKAKIRQARIPYQIPSAEELSDRLDSVLRVIYLVFNEGYSASSGEDLVCADLSNEAIRLARLLSALLPHSEVNALLALMLLHESRRASRTTDQGDLIPLEDQDRSQWNIDLINEGCQLVETVLRTGGGGSYAVQAAIAAVHAEAKSASATDWNEIVGLYDVLLRIEPTPIVALNRAVALAMRDGPAAGLESLDPLLNHPALQNYHLAHAARADLLRRIGKYRDAKSAYQAALGLVKQEPERRFLRRRLAEVENR